MGSTGAVGSWFCNSVASRFRNVLSRLVDESPPVLVELLPVPVVLFVVAAGFAVCACKGAVINGLIP